VAEKKLGVEGIQPNEAEGSIKVEAPAEDANRHK